MDWLGAFAGVPFLNGAVVLYSRIAADPGAGRDFVEESIRVFLFQRLVAGDRFRPPFFASERGFHEFIRGAHGKIFVLIHDAAVGFAVVGTIVTLLNQRPGFLFFALLAIDELLD